MNTNGLIFVVFNDSTGALSFFQENRLDKITGPINELQAREIMTDLALLNMHLKERPVYQSELDMVNETHKIVATLPDRPELQEWNYELRGRLLWNAFGRLVLFDNQLLASSNLGRHLLGLPHLGRNKAEGCAEVIRTQLPFLDVEARPGDVLGRFKFLEEFDLVTDATGEEALSLALNDFAVKRGPKFPPVVYSWVVGDGAAVQTMLCDSSDYACYKCSKPELSKEPRVRVLRNSAEMSLRRMGACGDGLYSPFPVSVSMAAASLALDVILGWGNGKPGARLRTRAIDLERSFAVKDTTLAPSAVCPACRGKMT
ncbi:MAG TPA: ThiF family adenylyltransferase [Xanthobacteraceae bacterium]|nr:ThiF family adenylyltransferase [Xanthobacteraceae bacterium]